jgi:hypothetical protein
VFHPLFPLPGKLMSKIVCKCRMKRNIDHYLLLRGQPTTDNRPPMPVNRQPDINFEFGH